MSRSDSKKPLKIENYAQCITLVKIPCQIPCAGLCICRSVLFSGNALVFIAIHIHRDDSHLSFIVFSL